MIEIVFLPAKHQRAELNTQRAATGSALIPDQRAVPTRMAQCPKCGEASLIRVEGCDQCTSCDYSKCW